MATISDKRKEKIVILSIGGNQGDIVITFEQTKILLYKRVGKLVEQSSLYKTKAWGNENQPDFLNQVLIFKTKLLPIEFLKACLEIERTLGRVRKEKWTQRTIDIDILFFDDKIINEEILVVPHPLIQERNFVLEPLCEVLPDFLHPVSNQPILQILQNCKDKNEVIKI